jgi:GAF domain-containing protein
VPIVRCHHENCEGSGYPAGISGVDIPIGARILSVVDCFDALMSDRPYRKRLTCDAALGILIERRGRMYDPDVVDTFVRIHRDIMLTDVGMAARSEVLSQIHESHRPPAVEPVPQPAPAAGEDVLAFVSLARLASGSAALNDVLALSTNLIHRIVPGSSGAWFMLKNTGDRLVVADAFGPAASTLRTLNIAVGDRLSGWVAANRQVIVNSDAALDLGDTGDTEIELKSCLSVPLCDGAKLSGVLSLYSPERHAFTDDQGRLIQMVAPHIAQAIDAAHAAAQPPQTSAAGKETRDIRLVARR